MAFATFLLALRTRSMATATEQAAVATREMAEETKAVTRATLQEAQAVERQVEQVEQQVVISASALQMSVQPWLVWEPAFEVVPGNRGPFIGKHGVVYSPGWHSCLYVSEREDSVVGWFTIRNVGNGIALLDMSRSFIYPKNGPHPFDNIHPSVKSPVVPPGDTVDVEFTIPATKSADQQRMTLLQLAGGGGDELFTVELAYGDALGSSDSSAKFRAHRHSEKQEWSVFEVEYRLADGKVITTRRYG